MRFEPANLILNLSIFNLLSEARSYGADFSDAIFRLERFDDLRYGDGCNLIFSWAHHRSWASGPCRAEDVVGIFRDFCESVTAHATPHHLSLLTPIAHDYIQEHLCEWSWDGEECYYNAYDHLMPADVDRINQYCEWMTEDFCARVPDRYSDNEWIQTWARGYYMGIDDEHPWDGIDDYDPYETLPKQCGMGRRIAA
jgi:hypothetical protein